MTSRARRHIADHDLETPNSVWQRFSIDVIDTDTATSRALLSMPIGGMTNPLTGHATMGPLAILVDAAAVVNHFRRPAGTWTMTSELALELHPGADVDTLADSNGVVFAESSTLDVIGGDTSLAFCRLMSAGSLIGVATVRSYYIHTEPVAVEPPNDTLVRSATTSLAELMAVQAHAGAGGVPVLRQRPDDALKNGIGIMHGGVASAGLELCASAALNADGRHMRTASVRVNFLRPFHAGEQSRYEAVPVRIGRTTAIADALAIGEDGRPAIMARVTAYR